MLKKIIVFFLIFNIYSCANYSRTSIDKLTGKSGSVKIVVVKPSVELFEVDAVGGQLLKAEWTTSAINNVEMPSIPKKYWIFKEGTQSFVSINWKPLAFWSKLIKRNIEIRKIKKFIKILYKFKKLSFLLKIKIKNPEKIGAHINKDRMLLIIKSSPI